MLVNACCKLLPKDLNDLVEDTSGDRDVLLDPGDMFNNRNLDWGDIVVVEMTLLGLGPG